MIGGIPQMLILVVILFAVSWLPLNLYHLVSDWSRDTSDSLHSSTIFFISHILAMSNVTCNPFVYFWLNKVSQQTVLKSDVKCGHKPSNVLSVILESQLHCTRKR